MTITKGSFVKMSDNLKLKFIKNDCEEHVEEFGNCIGIVIGPFDAYGPEVDVRWQPSNLRYAYHPDDLDTVEYYGC